MSDLTEWNSNIGGGFGIHAPEDEFLHGTGPAGDSLTETWYWNFHVPEAAINCFAYCWVHPNLDVVSGGVFLYKGIKASHLEAEMFDYRNYMAASLIGDGRDIRFPNGFRVEALESLNTVRMTYDDPVRQTRFDVLCKAVDVPIMRANNKHFEQLMHCTGTLVLRGQSHAVDCFAVRDRSWSELRPEDHMPMPPYTWVTGAFGPDFAFNVGSHDDPARNPDWAGVMDIPKRIFNDGWVLVKGEQRRVVSASKITQRARPLQSPVTHDYSFEDDKGDRYHITGRIVGQLNWGGWSNMTCHCGLVEWNWNGKTGWGESQECHWNDYVWRMGEKAAGRL